MVKLYIQEHGDASWPYIIDVILLKKVVGFLINLNLILISCLFFK